MTKAEAHIFVNPLWHLAHTGMMDPNLAHGRENVQVRTYLHRKGHKLACDNYFGGSWLTVRNEDGSESPKVQIEHRYDDGTLDALDA